MATGAKVKLGFKGTVNNNTGTYGTPVWSNLTLISDCTLGASIKEAAASMRAYGVELTEPTMFGLEINGKIRSDDSDTNGYIALETAFLARAPLDVLILDGGVAVNGSRGFRADWKVFKWEEEEGLDGVLYRSFTLKPCVPINGPPESAIVTSGAPVFTAL